MDTDFKMHHLFSDLWPCNYFSSCFNFYTAECHQIITQFVGNVIFYSEHIQKNLFLYSSLQILNFILCVYVYNFYTSDMALK